MTPEVHSGSGGPTRNQTCRHAWLTPHGQHSRQLGDSQRVYRAATSECASQKCAPQRFWSFQSNQSVQISSMVWKKMQCHSATSKRVGQLRSCSRKGIAESLLFQDKKRCKSCLTVLLPSQRYPSWRNPDFCGS
jgi:hypothetical protein